MRLTGPESSVKASFQMLFINRLAKVTDDAVVQGADPVSIIGVCGHEDCRNSVLCVDEGAGGGIEIEKIPCSAKTPGGLKCRLFEVKRTSAIALHMSAFDPKRTFQSSDPTSVIEGMADLLCG